MYSYCFSKSINAFFDISLRDVYEAAGTWPSDAIEVDDEIFQEYAISAPPQGKVRAGGDDGLPSWESAPALSHEQMVAEASSEKAYRMQVATAMVSPLQDAVDLGDASDSEKALLTSWKQYRVSIMRIDKQEGYPGKIEWPLPPIE